MIPTCRISCLLEESPSRILKTPLPGGAPPPHVFDLGGLVGRRPAAVELSCCVAGWGHHAVKKPPEPWGKRGTARRASRQNSRTNHFPNHPHFIPKLPTFPLKGSQKWSQELYKTLPRTLWGRGGPKGGPTNSFFASSLRPIPLLVRF